MALNGVNMPLAITGQESVWYNVWRSMGMTDEQVRSYFTGPVYLPWHRMANIDVWCGPLPKEWLDGQVVLQQKILARERALNMRPVLPAFAGHVPKQLTELFPKADIKRLDPWDGFQEECQTYFLNSEDPLYAKSSANSWRSKLASLAPTTSMASTFSMKWRLQVTIVATSAASRAMCMSR